jgi:type I restriction enzyme R subunit
LRTEIERLNSELRASQSAAEVARTEAERHARDKEMAQQAAKREAEERAIWERLAQEAESGKLALAAELAGLQKAASVTPPRVLAEIQEYAEAASRAIELDEAATRDIIDRQLTSRGWLADTRNLTYAKGTPDQRAEYGHCRMADHDGTSRLCVVRWNDARRCR